MQSPIEIKALEEEDLDVLIELVLDNEIHLSGEWPEIGIHYRNPTIKQQLQGVLESDDSDIWGVSMHGSLIGVFFIRYRELNSLELGYFVSKKWSNQGVTTAALKMLANKFSLEGYTLRAKVNISNVPSIQIIEKSGFTVEGRTNTELIYCRVGN